MAREEAKEFPPITQAFVKGKTIQDWIKDTWKDKEYTFFGELSKSPIKQQPKYRPFKTQEECWNEMLKHQPFGWLKSKKNGCFYCIGELALSEEFEDFIIIFSTDESLSHYSDSVYKEYTFADNSPFGIKEE